ncbi:L-2-amino-thiazoline-4-carboxylic acid hydrolase [Desertibaculum subflavum]|uniref:L-2-amino-thiazoline-4-carboxylic acid hydrolase n=1 Tax=Desertibaculum subflavum TaxID=2268458 RepID=UPI000E667C46
MKIPLIEQARIQAQVLVPLVQALRAELGEARADAIVREALGGLYRKLGERWWQAQAGADAGAKLRSNFEAFAAGGALDYEIVGETPAALALNVTGCRYARFYQAMGAPELGFLLVCSADFPMTEGFGGEVALTRTQTVMQGAPHCDFRYALKPPDRKD